MDKTPFFSQVLVAAIAFTAWYKAPLIETSEVISLTILSAFCAFGIYLLQPCQGCSECEDICEDEGGDDSGLPPATV